MLMNYTLTTRGKHVILLFFITGIFFSGRYMVQYFQESRSQNIVEVVENEEPVDEAQTEEPYIEKPYTEEAYTEEVIEDERADDSRYTLDDLDSLSTFIVSIHFEENTYELNEASYEDLDFLIFVLEEYSQEAITIASQRSYLGDMRRKVVFDYLISRGIDSSRISLYNFYGKHSEDDHVELFFENHFDGSGYSK